MMKHHLIFYAACLGMLVSTLPASAESFFPRLGGDVILRLGYDDVYNAQAPLTESDDIFGVMIASPELHFGDRLMLGSEIRYEGLLPPSDDRFFEDEGFFLRELFVRYDLTEDLTLQVGKYAPSFALASLVTPGMYGNNYNKEIELIDRIGATAEHEFDLGSGGNHVLSASAFFEDTSILSQSLGYRRGIKKRSDGGPSNTESFESFALSVQGSDIEALPGFTYKLGVLHQARGVDGVADENGFSLSAVQTLGLGEDRSLTLIGEVAPIWNFDGTEDDIIYSSLGAAYGVGPWAFVVTGTSRRRTLSGGGRFDDYNLQTSMIYNLGYGFTLDLAHEFLRDRNRNSRRIGFRFSKQFFFDGD